MRLLFIISTLNAGGAQRVLSNLVTNLPEDWEIDILLNNTKDITYPYRGNLVDLNLKPPANVKSLVYQFKVLFKRFFVLRKMKKENSYHACISFLESANIVNVLTGNKYCKTILSVHNCLSILKSLLRRFVNSLIKYIYNRADHIVAVSGGVKCDLVYNLGIREDIVTAICNGFPLEDIQKLAGNQLRENDKSFTFITMGRCDYQKGQWHLLRVFAHLTSKHDNCKLVILGGGSYMEYYKQLIKGYNIENKVILAGFINNPFKELAMADVLVFPSMFEGFGNAIIEAMALSIPVISTDYRYGAREILAPDTDINYEQKEAVESAKFGIITSVCSGNRLTADNPLEPQELLLLEAMELLYKDENLRCKYSEASKKRAQDFSIEKWIEQWRELLEQYT